MEKGVVLTYFCEISFNFHFTINTCFFLNIRIKSVLHLQGLPFLEYELHSQLMSKLKVGTY